MSQTAVSANGKAAADALRAELEGMATADLRRSLASGLRLSVEHLLRSALALAELERRGEAAPEVPDGLAAVLRRVARGELLAEVIVRFAGRPKTLTAVARLSVPEQAEALADPEGAEGLLRRRRAERRPRPTAGRNPRGGGLGEDVLAVNPIVAAETATAKDLADMVAEMVLRHPDPALVLRLVLGDPRVRKVQRG